MSSMMELQQLSLRFKQLNESDRGDEHIIRLFIASYANSPNTVRNYMRAIQRFRAFMGNKTLNEITWKEVEMYKINLTYSIENHLNRPLSPASVAAFLAPIKSLYKWGSDRNIGLLNHNPTTSVRMPAIPVNSKRHFLTKSEIGMLLAQLHQQSKRNHLIGLALTLLGLRVSELIAMEWRDFQKDLAETSVWLLIRSSKGGKSREVKVPRQLWKMFELYQAEKYDGPFSERDKIFSITSRQVERIIKAAGEMAGIKKKVTPHWLRHTNATLALLQGATLQQVQETLGHSHINTTQRYLHTVEQLKKAAPDFVEECLMDYIPINT